MFYFQTHVNKGNSHEHFRLLLTFLILILISVSSLSSIAKFDVHVIYFKPTDAPDIDREYHDKIMKDIQKYYQSEMTRHGFTDKTFPLETDENGKLVIHTINAKHDSEHYDIDEDRHWDLIEPELPFRFNNQQNWNSRDNVHLIVIGGLQMHGNWGGGPAMGFAWHGGRSGGNAIVTMDMKNDFPHHYLGVVAHELGHAFALDPGHNNHNNGASLNGTIIASGDTTEEWGNRMQMTKEEAILLDSRPIFRKITLQEEPPNVISGEEPADMDSISQDLSNIEVLMYIGAVSWMSLEDANLQSQMTKQLLDSKRIRAEIVQTEDVVRDWMLQTTSDGNVDVLILYGVLPTSIHPYPNSQPDGTVAEEWIESTDGNTILNHGDYFGYIDNNGVQTLQDIMDIPHITMWDFGLENNTSMTVTKDGKEITPSLTNFQSDRAFHLDELTGDWFAEKVLASDTGTSQATRADPVIVRDGNRGRIGIVYQTFNEVNPKGKVVAELIANFLLRNNDKISLPPVEPIKIIGKGTGDLLDTVSILPASVQSPNIGQQLKLSLKIANGKNVAGYQATVSFDMTALRYIGSANGDYLPAGAYVLSPVLTDNTLTLAATSFSGESQEDGTLATLTFEVVAVKASTVSLSNVLLTDGSGGSAIPQTENAEITEPTHFTQRLEDINKDGVVNIVDLTLVASNFGKSGENAADVNADGVVNIVDLALVAAAFGGTDSAPGAWHPDLTGVLTRSEIKQWLHHARQLNRRDPTFQRGLLILEQLLASLAPEETALLPNYPNPFNPETWIPYQLAKPTKVTLNIYAVNGTLVRTLLLGYQFPGYYTDKDQAAYWNGRNNSGEPVANGIYFYQLQTHEISPLRKMVILK